VDDLEDVPRSPLRTAKLSAMAHVEIVTFADEHVEEAGRLLAARHSRHREAEPLLDVRFEDPAEAAREVSALWSRANAAGAAALRDEGLVGYLIGAPRDREVWGDNVWVEAAGHAAPEPEDVRDLYASAAATWVERGATRHYALVPATDHDLVDAWFRLGFGQQQAHSVREVPSSIEPRVPDGFEIRAPREDDVEALIAVDLALPAHQRSSPVFSEISLPSEDETRSEWHSTLAGNEETVLIGLHDGRPVAVWSFSPAESSAHYHGLVAPEGAAYLAFASTLPESRGSGIGVALTDATLAAAAKDGYTTIVTDWRVTNLLASRFWPRRGFRPAFLRLYRSIP
jgi:ribosomal protein S18 acetylase RimI-like enzyme